MRAAWPSRPKRRCFRNRFTRAEICYPQNGAVIRNYSCYTCRFFFCLPSLLSRFPIVPARLCISRKKGFMFLRAYVVLDISAPPSKKVLRHFRLYKRVRAKTAAARRPKNASFSFPNPLLRSFLSSGSQAIYPLVLLNSDRFNVPSTFFPSSSLVPSFFFVALVSISPQTHKKGPSHLVFVKVNYTRRGNSVRFPRFAWE